MRACLACALLLLVPAAPLAAQGAVGLPPGVPPPPVAPDSIHRGPDLRATIRPVRLPEPLRFDGALDEAISEAVRPITGFIQNIPAHGKPASQDTEAWVLFDDTHICIAARCFDTRPPSQ